MYHLIHIIPQVSLSFSARVQLFFTGSNQLCFELNNLTRKTFLQLVKPGRQSHSESWSICLYPASRVSTSYTKAVDSVHKVIALYPALSNEIPDYAQDSTNLMPASQSTNYVTQFQTYMYTHVWYHDRPNWTLLSTVTIKNIHIWHNYITAIRVHNLRHEVSVREIT